MNRTCQNCYYGKANKDHVECHFHAPQIIHGTGTGWSDDKWPLMEYDGWCGEFIDRRNFNEEPK